MIQTETVYLEKDTQNSWRVKNSRVSLDSIVHAYWEGNHPEAIVAEFPTLSAEQIYGAIACYLHNKDEFDQYLSQQQEKWQALAQTSEEQNGVLLDKLRTSLRDEIQAGLDDIKAGRVKDFVADRIVEKGKQKNM